MTITIRDIDDLPGALAGDLPGAFPSLVRALQDDVFSGALRLTGDRHAAEDIAQETFLRAYRALAGYSGERIRALQVRGWIWTIAANLCRNRARSRSRKPEAELTASHIPADRSEGPEAQAIGSLQRDRLAELVADLPWAMAAAVVLRHVVGLGYSDVSAALDRPVGTVKSDVHRGLERLRASLEEEPL